MPDKIGDIVDRARELVRFATELGFDAHIEFNPCVREEADVAHEYDPTRLGGRIVDLQVYIALVDV